MYAGYYGEGDRCPECRNGELYYPPVENCTCHISPPCSACTDVQLECDKCGYQPEEPEYKDMAKAAIKEIGEERIHHYLLYEG